MLLVMLPMWMNLLIRTYSWMNILENNGLVNTLLSKFGIGPFQMLGNSSDAEDAVQEAVLSAWRSIKSLKDNSLFKPWLFKILSNKLSFIPLH